MHIQFLGIIRFFLVSTIIGLFANIAPASTADQSLIKISATPGGLIKEVASERPHDNIPQPEKATQTNLSVAVEVGGSKYFAVVPAKGFRVDSIFVDGERWAQKRNPKLMISQYRWPIVPFVEVKTNHSVRVFFGEEKTGSLLIRTSGTAGGTVVPSGDTKVSYGSDLKVLMTPDDGYKIKSIILDGEPFSYDLSVRASKNYTFSAIATNHELAVTFVPDRNIITSYAGENGAITPSGKVEVRGGAEQHFSIRANPGYKISAVIVDGMGMGEIDEYTFTNITASHSIEARFEQIEK